MPQKHRFIKIQVFYQSIYGYTKRLVLYTKIYTIRLGEFQQVCMQRTAKRRNMYK